MELKFKKDQKFQQAAVQAVVDVFAGQTPATEEYDIDPGRGKKDALLLERGFRNPAVLVKPEQLLQQIVCIQTRQGLRPAAKPDAWRNLTVEMETGTGKTYTYIKTMYELSKRYKWRKFIVVVPSVAIREGVYKSFQITASHFFAQYPDEQMHYFVYNSRYPEKIQQFANDPDINVMIINSQAFAHDALLIEQEQERFNWRKPIDVLAAVRPILVVDEPQSLEGKAVTEQMAKFNALFTLRYSATPPRDKGHTFIYRFDAKDAYEQKVVKKIAVKGITQLGATGVSGYMFLDEVKYPKAKIEIEVQQKKQTKRKYIWVQNGDDLYELSGKLKVYHGWQVFSVNQKTGVVEFGNGQRIRVGERLGEVNEEDMARLLIRETIASHLDRECELWPKGIKVLSLFFIDRVEKYRDYSAGYAQPGLYARLFEEEYAAAVEDLKAQLNFSPKYTAMLEQFAPNQVHDGYFACDPKTKRYKNSRESEKTTADDATAYEVIMKDKEKLLDPDYKLRFIFSHSALREGWDNPNVFQICALNKQSKSTTRTRQEIGRGMRLCVDKNGVRQDETVLGQAVHQLNMLTVVAQESYEEFCRNLQSDLAHDLADRPVEITPKLFLDQKQLLDNDGNALPLTKDIVQDITFTLQGNGWVQSKKLTEKYYADLQEKKVEFGPVLAPYADSIIKILDNIYDPERLKPVDAGTLDVRQRRNNTLFKTPAFHELWELIKTKSAYLVDFEEDKLVDKCVRALNHISVRKLFLEVQAGELKYVPTKAELDKNDFMVQTGKPRITNVLAAQTAEKYDLLGRIAEQTNLPRGTVARILGGMDKDVFAQYSHNPEDFILKACTILRDQLILLCIDTIEYERTEEEFALEDIFAEFGVRGNKNTNAQKSERGIYDWVVYDTETGSKVERDFFQKLEGDDRVEVYAKLPHDFYINTPVGHYTPDWAIAFRKDNGMHEVYFVHETKSDDGQLALHGAEHAKIECARKHFATVSAGKLKFKTGPDYAY